MASASLISEDLTRASHATVRAWTLPRISLKCVLSSRIFLGADICLMELGGARADREKESDR